MSITSSHKGLWSARQTSFREKNWKPLKYAAYLNSFEYSASLIYSNTCFWMLTLSDGGWAVWMISVSPKSTVSSCFWDTVPHPVKLSWIWKGCCRMCSRVWGDSVPLQYGRGTLKGMAGGELRLMVNQVRLLYYLWVWGVGQVLNFDFGRVFFFFFSLLHFGFRMNGHTCIWHVTGTSRPGSSKLFLQRTR